MDPTRVPDDVFLEIFDHLSTSTVNATPQITPLTSGQPSYTSQSSSAPTLAALSLTSRRFYALAQRRLLRELTWVRPVPTERNLVAWRAAGTGNTAVGPAHGNGVHGNGWMGHGHGVQAGASYAGLEAVPRRVVVGIPFDFSDSHRRGPTWAQQKNLHDALHRQLHSFTSLTSLAFSNTVISTRYTYAALLDLPSVESLSITDCTFVHFPVEAPSSRHTPAQARAQAQAAAAVPTGLGAPPFHFNFAALPLRHLALRNISMSLQMERHPLHPVNFLRCPTLESIELGWTQSLAGAWLRHVVEGDAARTGRAANTSGSATQQTADPPQRFTAVRHFTINIPVLSRELVEQLSGLLKACPLVPTVHLSVDRHNLSETQIGFGFGFGGGVGGGTNAGITSLSGALRGVTHFTGPLGVVGFAIPSRTPIRSVYGGLRSSAATSHATSSAPGPVPQLTHLISTLPLELPPLLSGLESLPRNDSLVSLDLRVRRWDVELLFAIRHLFGKSIERVVIRYGGGGPGGGPTADDAVTKSPKDKGKGKAKEEDFGTGHENGKGKGKARETLSHERLVTAQRSIPAPAPAPAPPSRPARTDFLPTLGANILADLPRLRTLLLLQDPRCVPDPRLDRVSRRDAVGDFDPHPFHGHHGGGGGGYGGGGGGFGGGFGGGGFGGGQGAYGAAVQWPAPPMDDHVGEMNTNLFDGGPRESLFGGPSTDENRDSTEVSEVWGDQHHGFGVGRRRRGGAPVLLTDRNMVADDPFAGFRGEGGPVGLAHGQAHANVPIHGTPSPFGGAFVGNSGNVIDLNAVPDPTLTMPPGAAQWSVYGGTRANLAAEAAEGSNANTNVDASGSSSAVGVARRASTASAEDDHDNEDLFEHHRSPFSTNTSRTMREADERAEMQSLVPSNARERSNAFLQRQTNAFNARSNSSFVQPQPPINRSQGSPYPLPLPPSMGGRGRASRGASSPRATVFARAQPPSRGAAALSSARTHGHPEGSAPTVWGDDRTYAAPLASSSANQSSASSSSSTVPSNQHASAVQSPPDLPSADTTHGSWFSRHFPTATTPVLQFGSITPRRSVPMTIPANRSGQTTTSAIQSGQTTTSAIQSGQTTTPAIQCGQTTTPAIQSGQTTTPAIQSSQTTTTSPNAASSPEPARAGAWASTLWPADWMYDLEDDDDDEFMLFGQGSEVFRIPTMPMFQPGGSGTAGSSRAGAAAASSSSSNAAVQAPTAEETGSVATYTQHDGDAAQGASSSSRPRPTVRSELGDYLLGWSRYCRALREVQMDGVRWVRRWEGDAWVEAEPEE